MRRKVLLFWSSLGQNCMVTGLRNKQETATSQIFAHFPSYHKEKSSALLQTPQPYFYHPTKYQFPFFNSIKILASQLLSLLYTIFISTLYSFYTQVIITLILINVQCLQNVPFIFEKGSNSRNLSRANLHHLVKNFLPRKIFSCPHLWEFPAILECYLVKP